MSRNKKLLDEFSAFCAENPDLRFWQALSVWSGKHIIFITGSFFEFCENDRKVMTDPFYWEDLDGVRSV